MNLNAPPLRPARSLNDGPRPNRPAWFPGRVPSVVSGRRTWLQWSLLTGLGWMAHSASHAQASAPPPPVDSLEGTTLDGQRRRLSEQRGRVVLVFYWSTTCAVCRDKMPELRANLAGWRDRPFTLFGVNMDARRQDWIDYERLVANTTSPTQRFSSIWGPAATWRPAASAQDSQAASGPLPLAYLIDKTGNVVERYQGRIPVAAWDRIAELL